VEAVSTVDKERRKKEKPTPKRILGVSLNLILVWFENDYQVKVVEGRSGG